MAFACCRVLREAMARKLRVQYPGAIYPVMNRGGHRKIMFPIKENSSRRRKGVPGRVRLARDLRVRTTIPLPGIA
jgi:hypothetical protein